MLVCPGHTIRGNFRLKASRPLDLRARLENVKAENVKGRHLLGIALQIIGKALGLAVVLVAVNERAADSIGLGGFGAGGLGHLSHGPSMSGD